MIATDIKHPERVSEEGNRIIYYKSFGNRKLTDEVFSIIDRTSTTVKTLRPLLYVSIWKYSPLMLSNIVGDCWIRIALIWSEYVWFICKVLVKKLYRIRREVNV